MGISNYSPNSLLFKPGVCTSTTRPTSPYEGQMIYETDTNRTLTYDGSSWLDSNLLTRTHGVRVFHNAAQSIATTTSTALAFNSEDFDTDNYHSNSVNNSRLTIPDGLSGLYTMHSYIRWEANSVTSPIIAIAINGTMRTRGIFPTGSFMGCFTHLTLFMNVGDFAQVFVYHSTVGVSRNVDSVAANAIIDPLSPQFEMYLINGQRV